MAGEIAGFSRAKKKKSLAKKQPKERKRNSLGNLRKKLCDQKYSSLSVKELRGADRLQTHTQTSTNIATYRLNQPNVPIQ